MGKRRTQARTHRLQKILAITLLICMAFGGAAIYAAASISPNGPAPTPTQQGR